MDIVEIDAASNNGVDEIRDLRDKVRFPPAIGRYKVYIIDEVHMLSIGAFNALLKTLEEPPPHVVFVLATTEPHKLPATILSRCQRFDFRRIPQKVLTARMKAICDKMNVTIDEESLHTIARWAEGGMRDALSLLDQCMSFCGGHITNDDVLNILGTADQDFLFQVAEDILTGNLQGLLHNIGRLSDDGKDFNAFLRDLLHYIRNLLIVKSCSNPESLLDVAESTLKQLKNQAEKAGEGRLIRTIELLSPLESEMRYSTQPRVLLELAAVKLCRPEQEASLEALLDRVEYLEKKLGSGGMAASDAMIAPVTPGILHDDAREENKPVKQKKRAEQQKAVKQGTEMDMYSEKSDSYLEKSDSGLKEAERKPVGTEPSESRQGAVGAAATATKAGDAQTGPDPASKWPQIMDGIEQERPSIHATLMDAKPRMGKNGVFKLIFPPSMGFHVLLIEQENNRTFIEDMIKKTSGQQVRLECMLEDEIEEQTADEDYIVEKAREAFGSLVEVVDED
jgi:DNA polymerase-3 subunit gamma/tau